MLEAQSTIMLKNLCVFMFLFSRFFDVDTAPRSLRIASQGMHSCIGAGFRTSGGAPAPTMSFGEGKIRD